MSKNTADIPEKKSDIDKDEETIDSGEDNLLGIDEDSSESQGLETQGNEEALTKNLDDMQVEPKGQEFNPSTMEAMVTVATESPEDDNLVQDVFQKGYLFKGHLVRPARVSVYKHE